MNKHVALLNNQQIQQKITRMTYEIIEQNVTAQEVVIVGINERGQKLAEKVATELKNISTITTQLVNLTVNNDNPINVSFTPISTNWVIVIDDVLDSGRTLMYAVKYLLDLNFKKIQTAVLINRDHKQFPIHADFVGLSLATTLQDHVYVEFTDNETIAYLN